MSLPSGVQAVVLDVEGTTTPITFVTEILFPYARRALQNTCRAPRDPRVLEAIELLRAEHAAELSTGADLTEFGDGASYAAYLMDQDRKSTGLKALQGVIWESGYRSGDLLGDVFDDVPHAFQSWVAEGLRVAIYSSGSVLAQQLLFSHTRAGDLTRFLVSHYDTRVGAKGDAQSYTTIAADLQLAPERILFLSDVVAELNAARSAGFHTGLLRRPGNAPADPGKHPEFTSFDPLLPGLHLG